MVRKADVSDRIYMDEAEGFLLTHALFSPPRTWPPLPPVQPTQAERLQRGARKMDWNGHVAAAEAAETQEELASHVAGGQGRRGKGRSDSMNEWFEIAGPSTSTTATASVVAVPKGNGHGHEGAQAIEDDAGSSDGEANHERCVICLMALRDRTVVGVCGHEFCFECIGVWANQSRRCPLCSADMAPFLLHDLDNVVPTKFYLPPLPTHRLPSLSSSIAGPSRRVLSGAGIGAGVGTLSAQGQLVDGETGTAEEEKDELDIQVEFRREVYRKGLFAKHIPSNSFTSFTPNPTPREIQSSPLLQQRATSFLRRELRLWGMQDVEYLLRYVLGLLKAIDVRSEPFIRLLSEVLDQQPMPMSPSRPNRNGNGNESGHGDKGREYPLVAEHLAHELYSWLRSPYKELRKWDEVVQYDSPSTAKSTSKAKTSADESVAKPSEPTGIEPSSALPIGRGVEDSSIAGPSEERRTGAIATKATRSRSLSRPRSRSRSASFSSSYSHSSYSHSRSPSPAYAPPRDPTRRDTFIPSPSPVDRQWDKADSWVDPDWAKHLEEVERRIRVKREKWEMRMERRERVEMMRREEMEIARAGAQAQIPGQGQMRSDLPVPVAVPIRGMRSWGGPVLASSEKEGVELLPEREPALEQGNAELAHFAQDSGSTRAVTGGLSIRGRGSVGTAITEQPTATAEVAAKRSALLERLAKAKALAAGKVAIAQGDEIDTAPYRQGQGGEAYGQPLVEIPLNLPSNPAAITIEDLMGGSIPAAGESDLSISNPEDSASIPTLLQPLPAPLPPQSRLNLTRHSAQTLRSRLRLRLKLESERANWRHNIAESKAFQLRCRLIESKIARQASETDAVLRRMDRLERDKEVRRRLMVVKMMAAETEGERRARELRGKLAGEKRKRELRKLLLARKKERGTSLGNPGVGRNGTEVGGTAVVMINVQEEQVEAILDDVDMEWEVEPDAVLIKSSSPTFRPLAALALAPSLSSLSSCQLLFILLLGLQPCGALAAGIPISSPDSAHIAATTSNVSAAAIANTHAASHTYHEPGPLSLVIILTFLLLLPITGAFAQRLLSAGLIGQILLGVIYGTPVGGWLETSWEEAFVAVGYVGLLGLVFEGGLTTSIPTLIPILPVSLLIALTGIALPLGLSFIFIPLLGSQPLHAFAAGSALASTSLGTTLAVLQPQGDGFDLRKTGLGTALLGAAVMDDVVAFVFSKVISLLGSVDGEEGSVGSSGAIGAQLGQTISVTVGLGIVLTPLCRYVFRPIWRFTKQSSTVRRVCGALQRFLGIPGSAILAILVLLVWTGLIAAATFGGTSALYGAYISGLVLSYLGSGNGGGAGGATDGTRTKVADADTTSEMASDRRAGVLQSSAADHGDADRPSEMGSQPDIELADSSVYPPASSSDLALVRAATLPVLGGGGVVGIGRNIAVRNASFTEEGIAVGEHEHGTPAIFRPSSKRRIGVSNDDQSNHESESTITTAFETHLAPVLFRLLAPLFFASIGYSIPFLSLWRGEIIWKGIVYALLMTLGKLACGIWIVLWSTLAVPRNRRDREGAGSERDDGDTAAPGAPAESGAGPRFKGVKGGLVLGLGMVARGEIGLLIAQIAYNAPNPLLTEDEYLVVIWAIVLCTIAGPVGVGSLVKRYGRSIVRDGWD